MTDKMSSEEYREFIRKQDAARQSRYKNIPTQTADGQKCRSRHEARFYNMCLVRQKAGEIKKIEREVRYEFVVNGIFICSYDLDFRLTMADDTIEYIDTKSDGTITQLYRIKKQLMMACHGIELKEYYEPKDQFNPDAHKPDKKRKV